MWNKSQCAIRFDEDVIRRNFNTNYVSFRFSCYYYTQAQQINRNPSFCNKFCTNFISKRREKNFCFQNNNHSVFVFVFYFINKKKINDQINIIQKNIILFFFLILFLIFTFHSIEHTGGIGINGKEMNRIKKAELKWIRLIWDMNFKL